MPSHSAQFSCPQCASTSISDLDLDGVQSSVCSDCGTVLSECFLGQGITSEYTDKSAVVSSNTILNSTVEKVLRVPGTRLGAFGIGIHHMSKQYGEKLPFGMHYKAGASFSLSSVNGSSMAHQQSVEPMLPFKKLGAIKEFMVLQGRLISTAAACPTTKVFGTSRGKEVEQVLHRQQRHQPLSRQQYTTPEADIGESYTPPPLPKAVIDRSFFLFRKLFHLSRKAVAAAAGGGGGGGANIDAVHDGEVDNSDIRIYKSTKTRIGIDGPQLCLSGPYSQLPALACLYIAVKEHWSLQNPSSSDSFQPSSASRTRSLTLVEVAMAVRCSLFQLGRYFKHIKAFLLEQRILPPDHLCFQEKTQDLWQLFDRVHELGFWQSEQDRLMLEKLPAPVLKHMGVKTNTVLDTTGKKKVRVVPRDNSSAEERRHRRICVDGIVRDTMKCVRIGEDAGLHTGRQTPAGLIAACVMLAFEAQSVIDALPTKSTPRRRLKDQGGEISSGRELMEYLAAVFSVSVPAVQSRYNEMRNVMLEWAHKLPYVGKTQRIKSDGLGIYLSDVLKFFGASDATNGGDLWSAFEKITSSSHLTLTGENEEDDTDFEYTDGDEVDDNDILSGYEDADKHPHEQDHEQHQQTLEQQNKRPLRIEPPAYVKKFELSTRRETQIQICKEQLLSIAEGSVTSQFADILSTTVNNQTKSSPPMPTSPMPTTATLSGSFAEDLVTRTRAENRHQSELDCIRKLLLTNRYTEDWIKGASLAQLLDALSREHDRDASPLQSRSLGPSTIATDTSTAPVSVHQTLAEEQTLSGYPSSELNTNGKRFVVDTRTGDGFIQDLDSQELNSFDLDDSEFEKCYRRTQDEVDLAWRVKGRMYLEAEEVTRRRTLEANERQRIKEARQKRMKLKEARDEATKQARMGGAYLNSGSSATKKSALAHRVVFSKKLNMDVVNALLSDDEDDDTQEMEEE